MVGVQPGDIRWANQAVCIPVPGLGRKSLKLGKTMLVVKAEDLDTTDLPEASPLPTEVTRYP